MSGAPLSAAPNAAKGTPTLRALNGIVGAMKNCGPRRQGLAAERSSLALHAEVRAAEKAGLSYGKYMLLKMQANKKPAGAPTPTSPKGDGI